MEEEEGVGPNWHTNSHSKEVVDGVEAADEAFHLRMEAFDDWYTEKRNGKDLFLAPLHSLEI